MHVKHLGTQPKFRKFHGLMTEDSVENLVRPLVPRNQAGDVGRARNVTSFQNI